MLNNLTKEECKSTPPFKHPLEFPDSVTSQNKSYAKRYKYDFSPQRKLKTRFVVLNFMTANIGRLEPLSFTRRAISEPASFHFVRGIIKLTKGSDMARLASLEVLASVLLQVKFNTIKLVFKT